MFVISFRGDYHHLPIVSKNQHYNEHIMNPIAIQDYMRRTLLELTYGEFQMEYYMLHGEALYV